MILNYFILSRHLVCLVCWTWFRKLKRTPQVLLISLDVKNLDLCSLLLMDWLLLGVKGFELFYCNQQKNYKAVRIPECPFHTLGLNIRDGLIYTKLVLSLVYSGR